MILNATNRHRIQVLLEKNFCLWQVLAKIEKANFHHRILLWLCEKNPYVKRVVFSIHLQ
jgi:hypothetical protein